MAAKASKLIKTMPSCIPVMPVYFETFTARNFNTSPLTIDGLLGDTYDYTLVAKFYGASGDSILDITCNTDTSTNYRNYEMKGLSTTASSASGDSDTAIELQNIIGTANPNFLIMTITGDSADERYFDALYSADGAILKQSSYWKNTAAELTQIVLTAASSVTCDATIALFSTPKDTSSENWQLVDTYSGTGVNFNTSPTTIFSGLEGDKDIQYKIDIEYTCTSNTKLGIRPNGDSGSNYTIQILRNKNSVLSSASESPTHFRWFFENTAIAGVRNVSLIIDAESGVKRLLKASAACSVNNGVDHQESSCWWNNTVDEITSFDIFSDTSNTSDLTAKIYKRKNPNTVADRFNLPFKLLKEVDISGDFSAGHTFSGLSGDSALMYKIEMIGEVASSFTEFRIQPNADSTSGNYTKQDLQANFGSATALNPSSASVTYGFLQGANSTCKNTTYIFPQSGSNRPCLSQFSHNNGTVENVAGWWLNSSDEITSIKVLNSSTLSATGKVKLSYIPMPNEVSFVSMTSFDGSDDYISFGDVLDVGTNDISISAWVKTAVDANADTILSKEGDSGGWWALRIEPSGKPRFSIGEDGSNFRNFDTSSATVDDDALHHIVVTYDRSTDTCTMYIDGSSVSVTTFSSGGSITSSDIQSAASCNIGNRDAGSGSLYYTSDLIIPALAFDVLDSSDVTELYNSGRPIAYQALGGTLQAKFDFWCEISYRDDSLDDQTGTVSSGTANGSVTIGGGETVNLQLV